jgi:membrane protein DedA with SNARE-associated domain
MESFTLRSINAAYGKQSPTISVGEWLITLFISAIPLVGLVMLLVWAFGNNAPPSKANYAKAMLILFIIFIAFGVVSTAVTRF